MKANQLKLSPKKMAALLVRSNLTLESGVTPVWKGVALPRQAHVPSWGVLLLLAAKAVTMVRSS